MLPRNVKRAAPPGERVPTCSIAKIRLTKIGRSDTAVGTIWASRGAAGQQQPHCHTGGYQTRRSPYHLAEFHYVLQYIKKLACALEMVSAWLVTDARRGSS
jgi:hypothetical protein